MAAKKRKKTNMIDSPAMTSSDDAWRARDDLHTIQRAHEIAADGKRLGAAKAEAKRQRESLDRIARLDGKKL